MRCIFLFVFYFFVLASFGQSNQSLKKQLLGTWFSEDDKKFQITFAGTIKKDFYAGKLQSTYQYWVKKDSLVTKDIQTNDVFNYAIMGLTEKHLTLMYLQRGNRLLFRKLSTRDAWRKQ